MKNVTPSTGAPAATAPRPNRQLWITLAVVAVVLILLVRACAPGPSKYEKIAGEFTQALQANDLTKADSYENAQTQTQTNRARVGHAADELGPLGKLKSVKDVTPAGSAANTHEFDLTFDKGTVHEKILFDPQDKIFKFRYDLGTAAK